MNYTWPTAKHMRPSRFRPLLQDNNQSTRAKYSGHRNVIDLLGEYWHLYLSLGPCTVLEAAEREAFFAALRGGANTVELYHVLRPVPRGTMRGTPVVATGGAAQGAQVLNVVTTAAATLEIGDIVGLTVDGALQPLMVRLPCLADSAGAMAIQLSNRIRGPVAANAPVIWDRPAARYRLTESVAPEYANSLAEPMDLELVEDW